MTSIGGSRTFSEEKLQSLHQLSEFSGYLNKIESHRNKKQSLGLYQNYLRGDYKSHDVQNFDFVSNDILNNTNMGAYKNNVSRINVNRLNLTPTRPNVFGVAAQVAGDRNDLLRQQASLQPTLNSKLLDRVTPLNEPTSSRAPWEYEDIVTERLQRLPNCLVHVNSEADKMFNFKQNRGIDIQTKFQRKWTKKF